MHTHYIWNIKQTKQILTGIENVLIFMPQMWFMEYQYLCVVNIQLSFLLFVLCFYSSLM